MSINIGPPSVEELRPRITVIGVGGAGGNAIANMIEADIEGVEFIVANTDAQALNSSISEHRIQLGPEITQGLGAGSRPEVGRAAAEETVDEIERALDGVNMVFIAAGMGGGTGTGAAPVIAEVARSKGILTVGVVTKPFLFEGTRRMRSAEAGIEELQKHVDTLLVIPNQNLFLVAKAETTFKEAFMLADEVLQMGVRSITDLMVMPGLINLDFADIRSVMNEMGKAMMGTGEGEGPNRALEAAERAIANPLLDGVSMQGAKGVIISIIGGEDMKLLEVDEAANHIRELVDADANIIWGSAFNPELEGRIRVSVVATGIEAEVQQARPQAPRIDLSSTRGPKRPSATPERTSSPPVTERASAAEPAGGAKAAKPAREHGFSFARFDAERAQEPEAEQAGSAPMPDANDDSAFANHEQDGFGSSAGQDVPSEAEDTFELTQEIEAPAAPVAATRGPDELLLDDETAQPVDASPRRTRMLRGAANEDGAERERPAKPASSVGSTLFERMANMTRSNPPAEEDQEPQAGSSMRIPRFLGRQNNQ